MYNHILLKYNAYKTHFFNLFPKKSYNMLKKNILLFSVLITPALIFSQVGINTADPKTTLDINGSLSNREATVSVVSNTVSITPNMSQYKIIGTATTDFTITADPGNIDGQRLVIFNNTTGGYTGSLNGINIANGYAVEFIYSNNGWRSTSYNSSIVSLYSSQIKIPPHANSGIPVADFTNHSNAAYDYNNWNVISKTSTSVTTTTPAKMQIIYEYQGTPFNLNKLYPLFTAGNNTNYPDTYLVNFIDISNSTGKTRITVVVNRIDNLNTSTANWAGTFLINFILINSTL